MLAFKTWSILQKDRDCSSHALILRRIVTTTERTTSYYETVRHISRCTIFEVLGAHAEPSNLCRVKEFKQVHPLLRGSCKSGGESMRNSPVTLWLILMQRDFEFPRFEWRQAGLTLTSSWLFKQGIRPWTWSEGGMFSRWRPCQIYIYISLIFEQVDLNLSSSTAASPIGSHLTTSRRTRAVRE